MIVIMLGWVFLIIIISNSANVKREKYYIYYLTLPIFDKGKTLSWNNNF